MHPSSSLKPCLNRKQRIFVVKSNMHSRFIQDGVYKKHDIYGTFPLNLQDRKFDPTSGITKAEIDRLMSLPSNLFPKNEDTGDDKEIKSILAGLIHKTVELDKLNGWHQSILSRFPYGQQQNSIAAKKFFTYRPVEEKIQAHVERLRIEIFKRRNRVETECANELGLTSPWKKTRYHRKLPAKYGEHHSGIINPKIISLNFDDGVEPHEQTTFKRQKFDSQQNYFALNVIKSPNRYGNDMLDEEREHVSKRSKSTDRCSVCNRECRKHLFCLRCDTCGLRFHGKCVKMTLRQLNKRQTPWQCGDCINAASSENREILFCVCKKPYDSRQFYVGCDSCEDWFHPECVGTSQKEIENIEGSSYICPACRKKSKRTKKPDYR